jgi:hypothetical protein
MLVLLYFNITCTVLSVGVCEESDPRFCWYRTITIHCRLDGPGFEPWWGEGISGPIQTVPEAHQASSPIGTWVVCLGKVAGVWH